MTKHRTRTTAIELRGNFNRYAARGVILDRHDGHKGYVAIEFHNRASALPPDAQERIARAMMLAFVDEFEADAGPVESDVTEFDIAPVVRTCSSGPAITLNMNLGGWKRRVVAQPRSNLIAVAFEALHVEGERWPLEPDRFKWSRIAVTIDGAQAKPEMMCRDGVGHEIVVKNAEPQ